MRSFALGGLVGAAGAIATVRRARRVPRSVGGLAAFEDAPCYLEVLGEEARRYREGGDSVTGTSKPT